MEHDPLVGQQLGGHRIQTRLGEGGMAWVYKAYHEGLQREEAIKVILPQEANKSDFRARFEREAQLLAKLQHSNIVQVFDYGDFEGLPYLAMQYVGGGTLNDLLGSEQPLEPQRAALYALQVARALHKAHTNGVVHRDVKPANMLLESTNRNKLLLSDFGLAKLFEEYQEKSLPITSIPLIEGSRHILTQVGQELGTPLYMAPEQFTRQKVDARTDVYALGVVLFQMLTGQVPFQADNSISLRYQHLIEQPRPVRKINPDVPEALEQITLRALAKDPGDRYQSADEMAQALKDALVPLESTERAPDASPPPRHKSIFRANNIALAFIIVLAILQFLARLGFLHWP